MTRGSATPVSAMRNIVLVLGDQLWFDNPALSGFDPARDRVVMIETAGEAAHVWSHKSRIAVFFAAMRHFAQACRARGWSVAYLGIDTHSHGDLGAALRAILDRHRPEAVRVCEPGEWRVDRTVRETCAQAGIACLIERDTHFLIGKEEFAAWARGRRQLRMEDFYRGMRRRFGVLMQGELPSGGRWNFDADNRERFDREGPVGLVSPRRFAPDAITREVLADVERCFGDHPGSLEHFGWPVTRGDALAALDDFVEHRLPRFGRYQDAMWCGQPFLYHSLLSVALNLRLLDPREVIERATTAYRDGHAPLASVEGFVRQLLGWREFVRGMYWLDMPALASANHFGHTTDLPRWYWTSQTHMRCMHQVIGQTLRHGYAHHIQRLMVTGNFALIAGLDPAQVAAWYLAVYVDAVEWVELPNVAGMSLYANGGRFTSKPYAASGAYIERMGNFCAGCRYDPRLKTGPRACPFTTFYWDFLDRHEAQLRGNPRTALMVRGLQRWSPADRAALRADAQRKRADIASL